ncbi:D-alanine--D-alanine ligase [candidate division KSB1 bacterium]|nr:D-alanine--D-alanine ligase [candidate division KSB1 bacterium]
MKVLILHGDVPPDASADEQDVLVEVAAVERAARELGHATASFSLTFDVQRAAERIRKEHPDVVFNLVESIDGKGRYIHLAPMLLHRLGIPFTGADMDAMYMTSNKIVAKRVMRSANISTADWISPGSLSDERDSIELPCIVKSVWEHASVGLSENSIVYDEKILVDRLSDLEKNDPGNWFAERYIDGREFNVSVIEKDGRPLVLPIAEMVFKDFPKDKARIVDYKAKWDESSPEYLNTVRSFDYPAEDDHLLAELTEISVRCWHVFGLSGYARVDFRVDLHNRPYILEVNANPCLSPDAGFIAACGMKGLTYVQVIDTILSRFRQELHSEE